MDWTGLDWMKFCMFTVHLSIRSKILFIKIYIYEQTYERTHTQTPHIEKGDMFCETYLLVFIIYYNGQNAKQNKGRTMQNRMRWTEKTPFDNATSTL